MPGVEGAERQDHDECEAGVDLKSLNHKGHEGPSRRSMKEGTVFDTGDLTLAFVLVE
jgi:hypothetical protein